VSKPRRYNKEFIRQQIGGQVPEVERDQCGYCGCWYPLTPDRMTGVCQAHEGLAYNGLTSEGWAWE